MSKVFCQADEAAETLGISTDELKILVRDGKLREFRDAGRLLFKIEDIEAVKEGRDDLIDLVAPDNDDLGAELLDEIYPSSNFDYEALNSSGVVVRDRVAADNQEEAVAKVRSMGYFPTKVHQVGEPKSQRQPWFDKEAIFIPWSMLAVIFMMTTVILLIIVIAMASKGN